jgi:protein-S-isoprenylcysteine O-methyltransferase Ste14
MKKILPPTLMWLCLALMFLIHFLLPLRLLWKFPITLLGLLPLIVGFLIMMTAWNSFRRLGTTINTFDQPGSLVVGGLYRYSRNPMYLGFALILAGAAWLFGSLSSLLPVLLFVAISDRWYIAFEEQQMHSRFGAAYAAYQGRVRRWL